MSMKLANTHQILRTPQPFRSAVLELRHAKAMRRIFATSRRGSAKQFRSKTCLVYVLKKIASNLVYEFLIL